MTSQNEYVQTAKGQDMCQLISFIPHNEQPVYDQEPLAAIYRHLDESRAEQIITRALGELAFSTSELAAQIRVQDFSDIHRQLRRLQNMAAQLGLTSFEQIVSHARTCIAQNDGIAFSAVWARLLRIAEDSLRMENQRQNHLQ